MVGASSSGTGQATESLFQLAVGVAPFQLLAESDDEVATYARCHFRYTSHFPKRVASPLES